MNNNKSLSTDTGRKSKNCIKCWLLLMSFIVLLMVMVFILAGKIINPPTAVINQSPLLLPEGSNLPNIPDSSPNILPREFVCPPSNWIDCMPGPGAPKPFCRPDYIKWAENNCPEFGGVAY